MIRIEHSVVINRPVEEVFAVLSNLENNTKWDPGFMEVKKISPGPIGVGTKWRVVQKAMGQRLESEAEMTEYEVNRKSTQRADSPFPVQVQATYTSVNGATRLNMSLEGEPAGFFKLAEPLLAKMVKRNIETDFANLKDLMEAHAF